MKSVSNERLCLLTFVLCAALSLGLSSVGWQHNLLEGHEFRQTQTALTARAMQREGWHLAYPLPLFGPPWSAPMEFPLYQACVAGLSSLTGCAIEPVGRAVSLAFFYLSLPACFLLLRFLDVPRARRFLFLGLLLVTPIYFYYSRVLMIESTALCASAWFLYAYCRLIESRRATWFGATLLLATVAVLAKSTTFLLFLVPAAWFTLSHRRGGDDAPGFSLRQMWSAVWLGFVCLIIPIALGVAWVRFSDRVKAANPLADFLTSTRLTDWNFGPLSERFQGRFWLEILTLATRGILLLPEVIFFIAFFFVVNRRRQWQILGLLGCYFAGPLVFANLYAIHDYYHYASGVFLLGALFLALCGLLDLPGVPRIGRWIVIFAALTAHVLTYNYLYFCLQIREHPPQPELGVVLGAVTAPDDVLLIYGLEWNPLVPYAADRRAIMVTGENIANVSAQEEVIRRVPPQHLAVLVIVGDTRLDRQFCQRLVERHHFVPEPLLVSDNTAVYFSKSLAPAAAQKLRKIPLGNLLLNLPRDAELDGSKVLRYTGDELDHPAVRASFSVRPAEIMTPFGLASTVVDGRRLFGAHAPTEIVFDRPPGATSIHADFGLAAEAYQKEGKTDGVEFRIELRRNGQKAIVLFNQFLNPASVLTDRGTHQINLTLPADTKGQLVLSTLPGPAHSNAFDWAYWTAVEIK